MSNAVKGVAPGFLLLPAREYSWELVRRIQVEVPNAGSLQELVGSKEFAPGVGFSGDDDFSIFEDNTLLLWELVRVLFAKASYPALQDNECVNVVALEFKGDTIVLHGEIIRSV